MTSSRRPRRLGALLGASVLALTGAATLAPVQASAAPSAGTAFIRGAHLSPNTPKVDVYLAPKSGGTQTKWLTDVGYGDVSGYRRVTAGDYTVSMRAHGAAATTKPVLSWTVDLAAHHAYTTAAIGLTAGLHGIVLDDSLAQPGAGTGLVRVIQASSRAGTVTATADGKTLATASAFGSATKYVSVPQGTWTVRVRSTSDPKITTTASIDVAAESVNSVAVLDSASGGVAVRTMLDAAGAEWAPTGSIDAGGGGTATHVIDRPASAGPSTLLWATVALAGLLVAGLLVAVRRRRQAAPVG
jgi:hypothetical protein